MSQAEAPAETEARQILAALETHGEKIDRQTDALNALGANIQWIVDNVKGIFEMFHNPMFGSMMSGMMPDPSEMAAMADAMTDMEDTGNGDGPEAA